MAEFKHNSGPALGPTLCCWSVLSMPSPASSCGSTHLGFLRLQASPAAVAVAPLILQAQALLLLAVELWPGLVGGAAALLARATGGGSAELPWLQHRPALPAQTASAMCLAGLL